MHGKQSLVKIDTESQIFKGLPEEVKVGRYHSLAVLKETLPDNLKVIGKADDGEIMAVADEKNRIYGLQFHPESIMTVQGREMLKNFIEICK